MAEHTRFRIATYNIHKCQGFDRKTSVERIIEVLRQLDADVMCLQEVVHAPGSSDRFDQAHTIARAFPEYRWCFGDNRPLHGGAYGNMTLSRYPVSRWRNHDVTRPGREPRGVLETELDIGAQPALHVFNVHLGTGLMERRFQAGRLLSPELLGRDDLHGPRVILGDFNEWTRGLTTRLLQNSFQTFRPTHGLQYPRTFPGMLPLLTLDHCYFEPPLELESTELWRSKKALVASDHLPLLATFRLPKGQVVG